MGKLNLTFIDESLETSNVGVYVQDHTAGTFTALNTQLDTLRDAIAAVSIGALMKEQRVISEVQTGDPAPTNAFAQRETKWLVIARDTVNGRVVSFEIPAADLSLKVAGGELMNISSGAGAALVTALEAVMRNPATGNAVNVERIVHVGRNI